MLRKKRGCRTDQQLFPLDMCLLAIYMEACLFWETKDYQSVTAASEEELTVYYSHTRDPHYSITLFFWQAGSLPLQKAKHWIILVVLVYWMPPIPSSGFCTKG